MEEQLKCPVCKEIPDGKVFLCRNKHKICLSCLSSTTSCSTCGLSLIGDENRVRDKAFEGILDNWEFPCVNKSLGCSEVLRRWQIKKHRKECELGRINVSLCAQIGFQSCPFQCNSTETKSILEHFQGDHKATIFQSLTANISYKNFEQNLDELKLLRYIGAPLILQRVGNENNTSFLILPICSASPGIEEVKACSWLCILLEEASSQEKQFTMEICIKSRSLNVISLSWMTTSCCLDNFEAFAKKPPFSIPWSLLKEHYCENGDLSLQIKIQPEDSKKVSGYSDFIVGMTMPPVPPPASEMGNSSQLPLFIASPNGSEVLNPNFVTSPIPCIRPPSFSISPTQPQQANIMIITAPITSQLAVSLQDKRNIAIFIPESNVSIPWKSSPEEYNWKWSNPDYANLPMSSMWKTVNNGSDFQTWSIIKDQLAQLKIASSQVSQQNISLQIKNAIASYIGSLDEDCNFEILNEKELYPKLTQVLPVIIEYCLQLPYRVGKSIPILKQGQSKTLHLTRGLCASLLANAFLCTIPHMDTDPKERPYFHFLNMFSESKEEDPVYTKIKVEKLKCILEYFEKMTNARKVELDSIISFERRYISQQPNWGLSNKQLCKVSANKTEAIEDAEGHLQVDFANKFVGGGILSVGMVQEDIRFAICPELIVSRLFTDVLEDDEVLVVTGAKQFSSYKGYRETFEWEMMETPQNLERDELGREMVQLVAMDALAFTQTTKWTQYQQQNLHRELHKCSVAFKMEKGGQGQDVATGNWGCGVMNGDPQLKFLIQWMAASEMGRSQLVYYTMGNAPQQGEISSFFSAVSQKQVTVGKMYKILEKYEKKGDIRGKKPTPVFDFVKKYM